MHIHKSLVLKNEDDNNGTEVVCVWAGDKCIMIDPDGNILDKVYNIKDLQSDFSVRLDLSKDKKFY